MYDSKNHGKIKNSKILRWRTELSQFDFEIVYRAAQTTPDIRKSASSYNVTSKPTNSNSSKPATSIPFACFYCKDINHGLLECAKFRGAPLHERSKFI